MKRKSPRWLSSAVFYQIYPPSFYDSNGDGIGDINGIIEKLDYVQSLGCNAIWLNPCFESPFRDGGYDISDYYKVAKRYGTNADLKRLFKAADKRGIKVCLDLVPGHTSIEHPWFKQSCKTKKNKYSNYYIWTDDWTRSADAGLNTIRGYARRNGNYAANFFWSQPSLNYGFAHCDPDKPWQKPVDHPDCQAVRKEMIKIMRYWLDMGAAGFRVDMAYSLVKNDKDCRQTTRLWSQVRSILDRDYPEAALIAEWFNPAQAIKAGFHADFLDHPTYISLFRKETGRGVDPRTDGTSIFARPGGDIMTFLDNYLDHYRQTKHLGYISIPTGNHDLPRISLGRTTKEIELVFAFILTTPGVPFIYYGDEIGMKYLRNLPSKEGAYTRTGSRTPMQWSSARNAGFSTATTDRLYLPIDPAHNRPTVLAQQSNRNSLLNKVRTLIALRREHPALGADGRFIPIYAKAKKYPFVYLRTLAREKFLIAVNPTGKTVNVKFNTAHTETHPPKLKKPAEEPIITTVGVELSCRPGCYRIKMPPTSYGIFKSF
jgi:maltose alpha-D-glucosyltransferase/alpha-amylase